MQYQFKMHSYTILVVSALVITTDASPLDNRIIGGNLAEEGQFPFQVSLRHKNEHMCGGAIINDRWVLTAAHCVAGELAENFLVITGSTNLKKGGDIYQAKKLIFHEDYQGLDIINDIGLVQTVEKIIFNTNVQPIALNEKPIGDEIPLTVSGWGSTELWGPLPDDLQWLNVYSVSQDDCIEYQKPFLVDEGMLCAFLKTGHGTCHGDSGSPLTFNNEILVGVVSWGRPCAKGFPDVFTKVSEFIPWIEANMK